MTDSDDVFSAIKRDVLAVKTHSEALQSSWSDLAKEIAYSTLARDCARALKSARQEALEEILPRLEDWAPLEAPWGEEVDLSKVDQQELTKHIDEMFGDEK